MVHMFNGIWGLLAFGLFATPTCLEQTYGQSHAIGWFTPWPMVAGMECCWEPDALVSYL